MWLLNTRRAELKFFVSPKKVPGGYAILSHVWDEQGEQTFQDIQRLRAECAMSGENPRDHVSDKIREFCKLAESHGYAWGWVDTCCIDKTSSAELSEAINSMFHYYSVAKVCYAFLRDVPTNDPLRSDSAFGSSRWHHRGWTLQELVAPNFLIFLSQDWDVLNTKFELAAELEWITNVPATVLRMEEELAEVSVARRMSWAARRETTRAEDIAYCLMGIFSINMPTLYGEGRQAFKRLQEEIMKTSIDTSLFAWRTEDDLLGTEVRKAVGSDPQALSFTSTHDHSKEELYLFAPSPTSFRSCTRTMFVPPTAIGARQTQLNTNGRSQVASVGIPTFSITPYGVCAQVPVFEAPGILVALLPCSEGDSSWNSTRRIGLLLTSCPDAADPLRPLYHSGVRIGNSSYMFRTVALREKRGGVIFCGNLVTAQWREIYIAHWPPSTTSFSSPRIHINSRLSSPFRFSEAAVEKLLYSDVRLDSVTKMGHSWDGTPAMAFTFKYRSLEFVIYLGRCDNPTLTTSSSWRGSQSQDLRPHWASVGFHYHPIGPQDVSWEFPEFTHNCSADHINEWPLRTRTFDQVFRHVVSEERLAARFQITLFFTTWSMSPTTDTLVANISGFRHVEGDREDAMVDLLRRELSVMKDDKVDDKGHAFEDADILDRWPEIRYGMTLPKAICRQAPNGFANPPKGVRPSGSHIETRNRPTPATRYVGQLSATMVAKSPSAPANATTPFNLPIQYPRVIKNPSKMTSRTASQSPGGSPAVARDTAQLRAPKKLVSSTLRRSPAQVSTARSNETPARPTPEVTPIHLTKIPSRPDTGSGGTRGEARTKGESNIPARLSKLSPNGKQPGPRLEGNATEKPTEQKGICAAYWHKRNDGTGASFDAFYKNLNASARQAYFDKAVADSDRTERVGKGTSGTPNRPLQSTSTPVRGASTQTTARKR